MQEQIFENYAVRYDIIKCYSFIRKTLGVSRIVMFQGFITVCEICVLRKRSGTFVLGARSVYIL